MFAQPYDHLPFFTKQSQRVFYSREKISRPASPLFVFDRLFLGSSLRVVSGILVYIKVVCGGCADPVLVQSVHIVVACPGDVSETENHIHMDPNPKCCC